MEYSAYEKYKETNNYWLGNIPLHWDSVTIKRKFKIVNGSTPKSTESQFWEGDITWVTPADFSNNKNGYITNSSRKITQEGLDSCGTSLIPKNSIVVTTRAPIGGIAQTTEETCTNQGCKSLVLEAKDINQRFVLYVLVVSEKQLNALGVGTTFMELTKDALGYYPFALPSYEEQQKIANFLDYKTQQIDQLIEKKKNLIEKLNEQRIAVITQAVTKGIDKKAKMKPSGVDWLGDVPEQWTVIKNRYLFSFGRGLGITKANLQDKGIPCISYGEVHSKYGFEVIPEKDELKCVNEIYLEGTPFALLEYGDFIFADTSEDIEGSGNFTYLNSKITTFAGYHTVIAKLVTDDCPRFLAYLFDSVLFRGQIRKSVSGVKVFSITQRILKNSYVWLPPLEEQKIIIDYLDAIIQKIDAMVFVNHNAIIKLEEYRSAIITSAVTGKIDVRKFEIPVTKVIL